MSENRELEKKVRAALEVEPRVNLHAYPVEVRSEGGGVTLSGTVEHIAAKRRGVLVASEVEGVREVVDALRVEPARPMGEGETLRHVQNALYAEPALCNYKLVAVNRKLERETVRDPVDARGELIVTVEEDGRVILGGAVSSLAHRRLAELLAWWVPGSTDVSNVVEVSPPEEDNDGEVLDAVELALDKDHLVDPSDLTLGCRDAVVTLTGGIPTAEQKLLAECDAWYISGVRDVRNELIPVDPA